MATPLVQEPTAEEVELMRVGEVATGVRVTERTAQKFIREYRACRHLMTADDVLAGYRVIASHPHLKASTKAITRVFHMKAVRSAAREFDAREHEAIHECCRRTGNVVAAMERYREQWPDQETADALILHYGDQFELHCPVREFG